MPALASTSPDPNADAFQVICAWPVSGQYGPGSRVLYYVLVAACVLLRRVEWLRNAVLAAALLLPAVAALHGVVLAALHVDGAVDLDIYGAFQICAIGILAAPVTVKLSNTYFKTVGRNLIFVWTVLIVMGLLSLTVEFYRSNPSPCLFEEDGSPVYSDGTGFKYEEGSKCNLTCDLEHGPRSSMRKDATKDIYVVPAPSRLNFGTATLLAAACCIPAILSLISTWNKILQENWKTTYEDDRTELTGTNGATVGKMRDINNIVKRFIGVIEVPVFTAAVLAILIMGERNLFSPELRFMSEPIENIGQWGPMVGTVLAVIGAVYLLVAAEVAVLREETRNPRSSTDETHCAHCHCHHDSDTPLSTVPRAVGPSPGSQRARSIDDGGSDVSPPRTGNGQPQMAEVDLGVRSQSSLDARESDPDGLPRSSSHEFGPSPTRTSFARVGRSVTHSTVDTTRSTDAGGRQRFARMLNNLGDAIGTPAPNYNSDAEFRDGKATRYPELPGELGRNPLLPQLQQHWELATSSQHVDEENQIGLRRQRSRADSFTSVRSRSSIRPPSPAPRSPTSPTTRRTFPVERPSPEVHNSGPASSPAVPGFREPGRRRDTLEVPVPIYGSSSSRHSIDDSAIAADEPGGSSAPRTRERAPSSPPTPAIIVSPDEEAGPRPRRITFDEAICDSPPSTPPIP